MAALAAASCARVGDFERPRPSPLSDSAASWIGSEAARANAMVPSRAPLTDDERMMRDLAYALITPPRDRPWWDATLVEFTRTGRAPYHGMAYDRTTYGTRLIETAYRSSTARYARLIEDVSADVTRIGPFFGTAHYVADMDNKREKSLAHVAKLSDDDRANALRRIAENAMIFDWVCWSLRGRASAYRYALERLVIETPSPLAVEAERAVTELERRVAAMISPTPAPAVEAGRNAQGGK